MEKEFPDQQQTRKQARQPPSVPFVWEEKPGFPKKNWKPEPPPLVPIPPIPIKLVPSIPFKWEEKPGTPIHAVIEFPWDSERVEQEETFELDFKDFESSLPVISNAKSVQEDGFESDSRDSETSSEAGSYETVTTSSPAGESVLECLFPLYPTDSGFLGKVGNEKGFSGLDRESNRSVVVRRTLTLGELMMMSRRLSCRQKADPMRENRLTREFMKKNAFGCSIFGFGNRMIGGSRTKKLPLRLKTLF